MIKRNKKSRKKSNPAWLDKILGKKRVSSNSITISVNDGDLILSGEKFVELGKELYELIENKLRDFKIEFAPLTGKGKRYNLNRTSFDQKESEDSDLDYVRRVIRDKSRFGRNERLPPIRA